MVALLMVLALVGADSTTLLREANTAAEQGQLEKAIARYRALLAEDPDATGAWLNLGNTAYRAGELARAIAAFRIAEAKAPRDLRVANSLAHARRDVKDRVEPPAPPAILRGLFFWHYGFSVAELGWILLLTSPLFWGAAIYFRSRGHLSPWFVGIGGAVLVALVASFSIRLWSPWRVAVVSRDGASVRTSTDRRSDVRFELNEGSELRWRERAAEWVRVSLPNGQQGWVHEDDIILLKL